MVKRCRQRPTRPMLQGSEVHNSMHNSIRHARKLMTCLLFLLFDKPESTEQPTVGKSQVDSICHQITCSAALALGDLPPSCPPTGPTQYDGYIVSLGQWGKSGSQRMGILPQSLLSSCPLAPACPGLMSLLIGCLYFPHGQSPGNFLLGHAPLRDPPHTAMTSGAGWGQRSALLFLTLRQETSVLLPASCGGQINPSPSES